MTTVVTASAWCDSAKVEIAEAGHCFMAPTTFTANALTTTTTLTLTTASFISTIAVGQIVTTSPFTTGAVVSRILGTNTFQIDVAPSSATTGGTITLTGDVYKMLLLKSSTTISRTYDNTQTNVGTPGTGAGSATNVGTDEVGASGTYVAGGQALTNVTPVTNGSGPTASVWSFSGTISWTSATISSGGCIIYNTYTRLGHANGIAASASGSAINRPVGVFTFGGDQSVTSGTFTVVMPAVTKGNAIFQIS